MWNVVCFVDISGWGYRFFEKNVIFVIDYKIKIEKI